MGRYLAYGIATNIHISEIRGYFYNSSFKFKEHKKEIINALGKVFDLNNYNIKEDVENIELEIKHNVIDENIHDFIKEINKDIVLVENFLYYTMITKELWDNLDKKKLEEPNYRLKMFNKDKCPIKFGKGIYKTYAINGVDISDDLTLDTFEFVLLKGEIKKDVLEYISIHISFIDLKKDYNRMDIEGNYYILRQLLILNKDRYKNKLAKSCMYYISG